MIPITVALPRMLAKIAAHYPGTKLSLSEYNYGAANDISGGVAQADPSFDRVIDQEKLKGREFFYRIGTCCIGNMVSALEKRQGE